MTNPSRSSKRSLNRRKESSLSMTGSSACNLTVSPQIRLPRSPRLQSHKVFTMRSLSDKKRPPKRPRQSFTTQLILLRLTTCTIRITPLWSLMQRSSKFLRMFNKRTSQILSSLTNLLFIQLPVDNSTIQQS